mgnify:CR=1 FL=1|tara:strand:- start:2400 stop:2717 length:318 start_codon:yes stop_codon:yes gene_type:complete
MKTNLTIIALNLILLFVGLGGVEAQPYPSKPSLEQQCTKLFSSWSHSHKYELTSITTSNYGVAVMHFQRISEPTNPEIMYCGVNTKVTSINFNLYKVLDDLGRTL